MNKIISFAKIIMGILDVNVHVNSYKSRGAGKGVRKSRFKKHREAVKAYQEQLKSGLIPPADDSIFHCSVDECHCTRKAKGGSIVVKTLSNGY